MAKPLIISRNHELPQGVPVRFTHTCVTGAVWTQCPDRRDPTMTCDFLRPRAPALLLALALAGCAGAPEPSADPARAHQTGTTFTNPWTGPIDKPLADLLRWRWEALREGVPKPPQSPVPVVQPQLQALLAAGAPPSATWIGHASVLVRSGGLQILTDPIFSERASPVSFAGPRRAQPPGIALSQLPPIDVVVISHNHYDHLDRPSVQQLAARDARTLFLVPLGQKAWFADQGIGNVVELDWWQTHTHRGVEFQLVPVQHWSARGLGDRNHTLWGGWVVHAPDLHWYFSGDTGYGPQFRETRARLQARRPDRPLDLALLAVGAYEPRWFMRDQHMNPEEAVRAHQELGARESLAIHWGTFELTDEPLDEPPRALARARKAAGLPDGAFRTLAIGETRWLGTADQRQSGP